MLDFSELEITLREHVRKWLEKGEIKYFIGYEKAPYSSIARPAFIYDPADVDRLVLGPACVDNLTRYVVDEMQLKPKRGETPDLRPIGVVVKPCDSKTLVELIKENIVPRDRVRVVGVLSESSVDPEKLKSVISEIPPKKRNSITYIDSDDEFILTYDGGELTVPKSELEFDKCAVCITHKPVIKDLMLGSAEINFKPDEFDDIAELEAMSPEERWAYWEQQFSRCVRCYACRNACSLCYCPECVFDRVKPFNWNEKTVELRENTFYHMVRAMHLAGRCVDCGECERACPVDIPIRKLNRFLARQAKNRFKIYPGMNIEEKPMFGSYDVNDTANDIL
jgi:formate dehydrogenase (coenzyme F420) beta subunit